MTEILQQQILTDKLARLLKGNFAAVKLCLDLVFIAHVWDDLYDKDRERTGEDISNAFRIALVEIPENPFYIQNLSDLRPLMMNVILQWQDANVLEHGNDHDKHMAYMLRAGIVQVISYCAYLIGGVEYAKEVGPDIRRLYEEGLQDFLKEFENA